MEITTHTPVEENLSAMKDYSRELDRLIKYIEAFKKAKLEWEHWKIEHPMSQK